MYSIMRTVQWEWDSQACTVKVYDGDNSIITSSSTCGIVINYKSALNTGNLCAHHSPPFLFDNLQAWQKTSDFWSPHRYRSPGQSHQISVPNLLYRFVSKRVGLWIITLSWKLTIEPGYRISLSKLVELPSRSFHKQASCLLSVAVAPLGEALPVSIGSSTIHSIQRING